MAAVALVSASCSSSKKTSNDMVVSRNNMAEVDRGFLILSDAQRALTANNNDFALQLFGKISGFDSKVVSPLSIDYLMGMLANGAEGATRDEILKAIKANGLSLDEVNNYYKVMMQKGSGSDESPVLSIANYMAVNKNVRIEEGFSRTVTDNYMAGMESLDFSSSKAVRRINEWCSKQTNGMVPRIIDSTDPSAVSYVMNAIYFNNTWVNQFDADDTRQERRNGLGRIEFAGLLAHIRGKVADQIFIGIAEDVAAVAVQIERRQSFHDGSNHLIALLRRRAQFRRMKIHVVKEVLQERRVGLF